MYQLKIGQESFTPVEGPVAGRQFVPGESYGQIPPGEEGRFEKIQDDPAPDPEAAKPAKAENKRAASGPSSEGRR
jgi:hypothetical protein